MHSAFHNIFTTSEDGYENPDYLFAIFVDFKDASSSNVMQLEGAFDPSIEEFEDYYLHPFF